MGTFNKTVHLVVTPTVLVRLDLFFEQAILRFSLISDMRGSISAVVIWKVLNWKTKEV